MLFITTTMSIISRVTRYASNNMYKRYGSSNINTSKNYRMRDDKVFILSMIGIGVGSGLATSALIEIFDDRDRRIEKLRNDIRKIQKGRDDIKLKID